MGLTDPTNVYTWAKPDTTTFYYLLATDSIGCQGGDIFKVYVYPTGINNLVNNQIKLELYPVPINDRLTINIENHEDFSDLWFEFYNILGHLVNQTNITSKRTELIGIELEKSVYFYRLVQSGKIISQGKLMVD
ncbi:MAG: T9SS type A sorting domain-containing protein [Bacteroidetes bacterium]|nr:T9SS type A sorting domain-containing protein [Bacteroidota bacterium]